MTAKLLHELGGPLNGMYLSAQSLERRLVSPGQLPDTNITTNLRHVVSGIKRLNALLAEYRSAARAPKYDFKRAAARDR